MFQATEAKAALTGEARRLGIDLIGIAAGDRFAEAPQGHKPTDILPAAKSIVVLAQRFLAGPMNNGHWTSYTAVHEGNIGRLDSAAYYLSRFLEEQCAAEAIPVPAMIPFFHWDEERQYAAGDLSHKHAAVAAGLGAMGKNSLLITPQFGNRVNLVSIVTDLVIEPDPIVDAELCPAGCRLCVDACPAGAIKGDGTVNQRACRGHCWTKLPKGFAVLQCWRCREVCPANGPWRCSK